MSVEYFVMAYVVPLKVKGMWFTHEEDFGGFPTLEKALKKAYQVSKRLKHSIELFRIIKYGADGKRMLAYKSVQEWLVDYYSKKELKKELQCAQ